MERRQIEGCWSAGSAGLDTERLATWQLASGWCASIFGNPKQETETKTNG